MWLLKLYLRKYEEEVSIFILPLPILDCIIESQQEWLENDTMFKSSKGIRRTSIPLREILGNKMHCDIKGTSL